MNNENQNQNEGKEALKVEKAYKGNVSKIIAILKGEGNVALATNNKVPKDGIADVVNELMKDKKEAAGKNAKTKLQALLDGQVAMNKAIAAEEKKFADFKLNKKKEFNKQAAEVWAMFDGISNLEKEYYEALGQTLEANEPDDEKTEE